MRILLLIVLSLVPIPITQVPFEWEYVLLPPKEWRQVCAIKESHSGEDIVLTQREARNLGMSAPCHDTWAPTEYERRVLSPI